MYIPMVYQCENSLHSTQFTKTTRFQSSPLISVTIRNFTWCDVIADHQSPAVYLKINDSDWWLGDYVTAGEISYRHTYILNTLRRWGYGA